ncbi:uncharacterized protein LOC133897597 [Phragmites australis]|uniref:uncharacterized protein LOC133897597 n=1 Tax=Phragmites australis TaxID=29695 RepID=UPI002D7A2817|nr:uncharacterized protein LOC133897597 [Phragmites australis]
MTAEGTACNGAGEAPKAEFAAEKVAVSAASPEERAPREKEGDEVGGSFVIVNGDSDGLSDRGSDLGKMPDEDPPSEVEDVPGYNAAPDAAVGRDHGAAGGEVGASGAALGVSLVDGRDRAAEGSEVGADEGKGEQSADFVAEVVQQEAAGGEQGGAETMAACGSDRAVTGADSDAPAVDSEVDGKEGTREESAAADVAKSVVHEASSAEPDGEDAAAESRGHDDSLTYTESGSAAMESEVYGEDSKEEQRVSDVVEPVEQGTAEAGALMANGHICDSFEAATEAESHADESKPEQNATEVAELVDQDAVCGEQDVADALQTNGHIHVAMSADSCIVVSESKVHANETKGQKSDQQEEGAPTTEAEVLEGVLEAVGRNYNADSVEEPVEEEVDANGLSYAEGSFDVSGEPEAVIEKVEGEATCGILQLEQKMDKEDEGSSYDDCTAGVACSNEEVELPVEEGINEAAPDIGELEEVTENTSQEIVQGDRLVKDGVCIGVLHSLKPESDPSVESSLEQKVQVEVSTADETASKSDLKADNVVEVNTEAPLHSQQDCDSAKTVEHEQLEAPSVGQANEIYNDVAEVEPKKEVEMEVVGAVPLQAADVAEAEPKKEIEMEVVGAVPLQAADVAEAEPKKEIEMEVVDAVSLQEATASAAFTFHDEPRPIDLVDSDSFKHSSPATELESCDHIDTKESISREISDTTVDQLESDASLEPGTTVSNKPGFTSETGDESQGKPSDTAVDQGEPVTLNVDKLVVVDDAQPCSATGYESVGFDKAGDISKNDKSSDIVGDSKSQEDQSEICNASTTSDECSSRIGNKGSSPINEETHKYICSENVNASTKSSVEVETKCLEALEPSSIDTVVPAEHKDGDKHACDEETKIVKDTNELHGDLDKNNTGDAQVISQQKIYIIKVPRFAGEDLWAKIQDAHVHLDQMTQERDAINIRKQKQKAVCDQYREKLEAARREEREARAAHVDKKNDLNSVRSMIGKLNQANSVEEIDEMIATKERIMQHETISLKEEKLLIKEINELKAQRKQLCSNMGSKAEINEALDQKDHVHERHKTLKKDSDVLFTNLKYLEENTRKIQKSFDDERIILRKLNEEYRAANELRQKAYSEWSQLKAEPFKKNQYFFMYKDDQKIAGDYIRSGDMYGLQLYCNNQVERVMEIWNKDKDFRKQYVEANKVSTLRRLGTHDGRRLGPDEDPPVIPSRRPSNPSSSLTVSSPDVPISTSAAAPVLSAPVSVLIKEDSFPVLPPQQISNRAKSKASGSSDQNEKIAVTVSEREDVKQTEQEKARLMEEELELARKAEELARREEKLREERDAAEKERLRLEQKAKAKEAEERKRRKAEKAQERAEFKARKEAEMKEKKKAKKDKKKGPADSSAIGDGNATAMATADTDSNASDNPRDVEVPQTAPKRLSRPAAAMKQLNRIQPMPAPLRNRGKRKMRQYVLIAAAVLLVLALFVAGNYIPRLKSLRF